VFTVTDYFSTTDCVADANICKEDDHQICDTPTTPAAGTAAKQCRCKTSELWKKIGDKCGTYALLMYYHPSLVIGFTISFISSPATGDAHESICDTNTMRNETQ
jgi:hypothetical protein